ncbi:MAG: hypothetical protein K8R46_04265, partial [Pirellulales bacterium]|nr:hypothetical protein [Pirellulales bacterium]
MKNLRDRDAGVAEMRDFLRKTGLRDDEMDRHLKYDSGPGSCFPYCGDGGDGPPGGGTALGGVSLDRVAQVIADLKDIRGATFDPVTGQLIIVGAKDLAFPAMDIDDLVVAIRSIYTGQEPSMSIEPCNPGLQNGCMKVHYNGRFQLPDHPDWGWVEYDLNGKLIQTEQPATFLTRFGRVIFEA